MALLIKNKKNTILMYAILLSFLLMCNGSDSYKEKNAHNNSTVSDSTDYEFEFYSNRDNQAILEQNLFAVRMIQESQRPYNNLVKDSLLHVAEIILKEVIIKEKIFYKAYVNLSNVYIQLKEYDKAITILKDLIKIKEYPSGMFNLGILYEKQNKTKLAVDIYTRALDAYNNYLNTPMATIHDEKTRDILFILIYGKEKAIDKIDKEIKDNPEDNTLLIDKDIIKNFDRKKFINSF